MELAVLVAAAGVLVLVLEWAQVLVQEWAPVVRRGSARERAPQQVRLVQPRAQRLPIRPRSPQRPVMPTSVW